jgi:transposase
MPLPEIPKGLVILLGNARFHQSNATRRSVKKAERRLLFLPVANGHNTDVL